MACSGVLMPPSGAPQPPPNTQTYCGLGNPNLGGNVLGGAAAGAVTGLTSGPVGATWRTIAGAVVGAMAGNPPGYYVATSYASNGTAITEADYIPPAGMTGGFTQYTYWNQDGSASVVTYNQDGTKTTNYYSAGKVPAQAAPSPMQYSAETGAYSSSALDMTTTTTTPTIVGGYSTNGRQ